MQVEHGRPGEVEIRETPSGDGRWANRERTGRSADPCRLARDISSAFFDVAVSDLMRAQRSSAEVCHARHVAMYLSHVSFQISLIRVAKSFGRDRTSVAHAIRRIEDHRDDPDFDALLARLERLASSVRSFMEGAGEGG